MFDKVELELPFKDQHVIHLAFNDEYDDSSCVDPTQYDFKLVRIYQTVSGELQEEPIKAQTWDTISTGLSGMAVGFFPNGNGFNRKPHVRIKCSPAKLLQGHNVFGSEDPTEGVKQMLGDFAQSFPKIADHLDFKNAQVKYLDCTYSAYIRAFFRTHVYRTFRALASSDQKVSRHDDYLQIGSGSEYTRAKIYYKHQELLADLKDAKRKRDRVRVAALSDKRVQDWSMDLMRFEATLGHRRLLNLGIPTRLDDFISFNKWFKETHSQTLCHYLWSVVFTPYFTQLEGHSMKSINDDDIRAKIDKKHINIKDDGKICKRRANAVWKTYKAIKVDGYDVLKREDNKTFRRNVKFLEEAGISKAMLKTLDPASPENVIPLVNVINIDFKNQRPDFWREPLAGYEDQARLPKQFAPFRAVS